MPFEKNRAKTGGREKGTPNKATLVQNEFEKAFEDDKKKHGTNIFQFFFEQAREDAGAVLVALMRKILPDMKQVEVVRDIADMPEVTEEYFKGMVSAVPLKPNDE